MQELKQLAQDAPANGTRLSSNPVRTGARSWVDQATVELMKEFNHDARAQGSPGNHPGMDGPSGRKPTM
jgi:hypothetical protein